MVKRTAVLIIALVLAGIAAFSIWQFLRNVEEEAKEDFDLVTVFRAREVIPAGETGNDILADSLFVESQENLQFLPGDPPSSTVAFLTEADLRNEIADKVTAGPIARNEILTRVQFVQPEEFEVQLLSETIPAGKQAITITVDETRGVAGFVRPGDLVNVVVTVEAPTVPFDVFGSGEITEETLRDVIDSLRESANLTTSRFVLQGLPVLAVGTQIVDLDNPERNEILAVPTPTTDEESPAAIRTGVLTLEVTAEEAERLAFAFEEGRVWLTLVPADFTPVTTQGVTRESLFE